MTFSRPYQLPSCWGLRLCRETEPHPARQFSADDSRRDIRYLAEEQKKSSDKKTSRSEKGEIYYSVISPAAPWVIPRAQIVICLGKWFIPREKKLSSDFSQRKTQIRQVSSPFFGSMLNFLRPIDICFSLLECLFSESCDSISCTTSHNSSLICWWWEKRERKLITLSEKQLINDT